MARTLLVMERASSPQPCHSGSPSDGRWVPDLREKRENYVGVPGLWITPRQDEKRVIDVRRVGLFDPSTIA